MKKIYRLMILAILCSSCDDFLEVVPVDTVAPETYYQTEDELTYAKASVYSVLKKSQLWRNYALYLYGWTADEGYMNRTSFQTGPWNYNYTAADSYNSALWNILWDGVNSANVVLDNVDNNTDIDEEFRNQVRGEVLFLRGYYYFLLVQNYGGVPLKLTSTTSVDDVDIARASVAEVYAQIIKDMEEAEGLVKDITDLGFGGQVSKSAVRGLLARVNLYMAGYPLNDVSRYPEAKKWAQKVIDSGIHALNESFSQVFINHAADLYDIKESIWEVEFYGNGTDVYAANGYNGYINGLSVPSTATDIGQSDAYMSTTSKLNDVFEAGDLRKFWSIGFFTYGSTGTKTYFAEAGTILAKSRRYPGKWRREYETVTPKYKNTTPENVPLLRYSDVLLMYAEAENELNGPTNDAIAAVNAVRQRGWASGIKSITVTGGGSGYTSAPTVSFENGGGSGAEATAVVKNRAVTSITLTRDAVTFYKLGSYTSAPDVVITGGGGTGAKAVAEIYKKEDADISPDDYSSAESFRQFIRDERMRELSFEYMRKADLIRWGIFVEAMQEVASTILINYPTASLSANYLIPYVNVESKHLLMAIPDREMALNAAMTQNEGW
jgi:hypothetical protein